MSRKWYQHVHQWLGSFLIPWLKHQLIKSGNYDPSKSTSWKVLETLSSRLKLTNLWCSSQRFLVCLETLPCTSCMDLRSRWHLDMQGILLTDTCAGTARMGVHLDRLKYSFKQKLRPSDNKRSWQHAGILKKKIKLDKSWMTEYKKIKILMSWNLDVPVNHL